MSGAGATPGPLHALVAAWGAAAPRFDRFRDAAARLGARLTESSAPNASARVGFVGEAGAVLAAEGGGPRRRVALGSGLLAWEPGRDPGARLLDGAPDDVAAIAADARAGTLAIATTAGNHRLFVAEVDGGALVSSQLGLLAAAMGGGLRVDRSREDFLLGFGFLPDGRTPYAGVRAHPAGTERTWGGGDGRTEPAGAPALDLPDPPADPGAARRALHDALFAALEEQAGPRRRHAVLLGGFDSALVVAGLRGLGHEVATYTFAFGDPRYEQRHAEEIATRLGARHHRVAFTPGIIGDALERFAEVMSQPAAQPHYQLHTAHASRVIAADGHDHVFTGDGCDAVFLGYPTVSRRAGLVERLAGLPGPARRALFGLASARAVERRLGHVARMARSTLGSLALPWPARGHLPTRYLDDAALARLRLGPPPPQDETVERLRLRLAEGLEGLDPVRLAFHGNALTGQSRTKVEGSVTASGVAHLSPYLHPHVKALAAALPVERLRPAGDRAGSPGKALLLDMVRERGLLPDFVLDMPKQSPSDSPIDGWYAGPLRPLVHRMLAGLPFEYDRGYVDELLAPKRAEAWYRERVSLGHHAFQAIGLLCSYAAFTGRAR